MDHKKGTATFSPRFPPKKPKGPVRVRSQYGYSALLVSVPVRPRTRLYPYGKSATGTKGYGALRVRGICLGSVPLCPLGSIRGPVLMQCRLLLCIQSLLLLVLSLLLLVQSLLLMLQSLLLLLMQSLLLMLLQSLLLLYNC